MADTKTAPAAAPAIANITPANETTRELAIGEDNLLQAEQRGGYKQAGPLYAGVNVMGDIGLELGVATGGNGKPVQRTGFGIYLRSDHIAHREVDSIISKL